MAISGLAVTFPLMNLSTAFGTLVGMGAAALLSILLGQKNYGAANKVLGNVVSLNVIIGIIFAIVSMIFLEPILYFFGASENTLPYAKDYMQIILCGNVITHLYFGLNAMMRSSGNPKKAMYLTIFTVFFNTLLDPVFIFWFDMGIKGAAWATVIAQIVALIIVMTHFSDRSKAIHFEKGIIRLDARIAKESLAIGFGPFLMNSAACLVTLFINQQLRKYSGDLGIGAFGICNRFSFMFIMICMGLNQGMQPIAGYNFGARNYSRVKEVFWKTVWLATIATVTCFIISMFLSEQAVSIFTHDPELIEKSSHALRVLNSMVFIIGAHIVSTNLFQCLGLVRKSIILSLSRQILFLIPLLYLLPLKFGETGIWMSYPVSDVISCILAFVMLGNLFRKFNRLKDGENPSDLGIKF